MQLSHAWTVMNTIQIVSLKLSMMVVTENIAVGENKKADGVLRESMKC